MDSAADFVVLVDESGKKLVGPGGTFTKLDKVLAHRRGLLHLAVSVFIFNDKGQLLLQKRAANKYHSPGKWSNTCCTHPFDTETPADAAERRLVEEMGMSVPLKEVFTFSYRGEVGNGLIENEFDHVFFGFSNQDPVPNSNEVSAWRWANVRQLRQELKTCPDEYTVWLQVCFAEVVRYLDKS